MRERGSWTRLRLATLALVIGALLMAIVGVTTLRAPVTHAESCTYSRHHDEGYFHTNLCVYGPYYDSGGKYYTFTGSCWLTSAQGYQQQYYPGFDFLYQLGCTQQDNVQIYNWLYTYKAFCSQCTPAVPVVLTVSRQRAPAGRTVQLFTNGYTGIFLVNDKPANILFPNPGDGAVTQQYLP